MLLKGRGNSAHGKVLHKMQWFEYDWRTDSDSGCDALQAETLEEANDKLNERIEENRALDVSFSAWLI
jgi:hypothetical protein